MKTLLLLCAMTLCACAPERDEYQPVYHAWLKQHPASELSYDEWRVLYLHALLPEQRPITTQ